MKNLSTNDAVDFLSRYQKNTNDIWRLDLSNLEPEQKYYFYNFTQLYLKKI